MFCCFGEGCCELVGSTAKAHAVGSPASVLTESMVKNVFGVRCRVMIDPTSGQPMMLPLGRHGLISQSSVFGRTARPRLCRTGLTVMSGSSPRKSLSAKPTRGSVIHWASVRKRVISHITGKRKDLSTPIGDTEQSPIETTSDHRALHCLLAGANP